MNFYRTISYTSAYTGIQLIAGLITTKITAKYLGTQGAADLGMYYNAMFILTIFSSACLQTALVRGIASNKSNPEMIKSYIISAFGIYTRLASLIAIFLILGHKWLSLKLFGSYQYSSIFLLNGILYVLINSNILFSSYLNGIGKIKELTVTNIISSIILLIMTIILSILYQLYGVIISAIVSQFIIFLLYLRVLKNEKWLSYKLFFAKISPKLLKEYAQFAIVTIITILTYLNQMVIRDYIQDNLSKHDAGLWSAMTKLSDYYLTFITSILSVYYLPKLSEYKNDDFLLVRELRKGYKRILPMVIIMSTVIWLLKDLIIKYLLTTNFNGMGSLFFFQMVSNVLKTAGLLILYLIPVFAMNKVNVIFIFSLEIINLISHYYMINKFGLIGTSYAIALTMGIYVLFGIIVFKKYIIKIIKSAFPLSFKFSL